MLTLENIVNYFLSDPLKILTWVGGSGGIVYWINLYRNRIRLQVKLFDLGLYGGVTTGKHACIRFEIENIGNTQTSLNSSVSLSGFIPLIMTKRPNGSIRRRYYYEIQSTDRSLPPLVPKTFEATCIIDADERPFLCYMTYVFTPTRGRSCRIRIQSGAGSLLPYCRFIIGLLKFRLFGKLPV